MLSLKRKKDEKPEEDGTPLRCRFLDGEGYCGIHPDKPGVCWLYPFASWIEADARGQPAVHATFQFTGDCPGFYLDGSIDSMIPILEEYSTKLYSLQYGCKPNYTWELWLCKFHRLTQRLAPGHNFVFHTETCYHEHPKRDLSAFFLKPALQAGQDTGPSTAASDHIVTRLLLLYIWSKQAKKRKQKRGGLPLEGLLKVSFYLIPVDHIPPSRYIIRSAVLVFEIVGMFPYIKTQ